MQPLTFLRSLLDDAQQLVAGAPSGSPAVTSLFWPAISAAERQPGGVLREGNLTALLIGEPGVCMYVWGAERLH